MTRNIIAFQKGFICTPILGVDNRHMAMNVQAELMRFGYMLTDDAFQQLGHADSADIKDFYVEIIDYLKNMTGGLRDYSPIYPGFPEQVMEMSEYELWCNQFIGYLSGGSFTANAWTKTKKTAFEHVDYKMIEKGTEEDFKQIFVVLSQSGTSLVPSDLKVIEWFVSNYKGLVFPETVPFKENLCTIFGVLIKNNVDLSTIKLPKLTATDILRIVVYMSDGDISLPAVPNKYITKRIHYGRTSSIDNPDRELFKFKKFSRKERKFILHLLDVSDVDIRDMKLKSQRWVRLGEILHPGEYAKQYPHAFRLFDRLRNEKVVSWHGQVQAAFDQSFDLGLAKLSERPGEFLRRLDWMIRTNGKIRIQSILDTLSRVGRKSSNKVLFEVYTHFEERSVPKTNRTIFIKGARKSIQLPDLPAISKEKIGAVQATIFDIIKSKLTELPELGDCWIDEELKKIPLPTNMRSLNDTLVPVIRGQRIPMATEKNTIRAFIHWFDNYGNLDLDLHGFLLKEKDALSFGYNGQHSSKLGVYSGDVRNRRGACAEYVDIDVVEAVEAGYQYYVMLVHNYNGGKLSDIKECVAGIMEREHPLMDDCWVPSTITNCMKLTSSSDMTIVCAYDLITREYIHLDVDGDHISYSDIVQIIKEYTVLPKVSVYDLLSWHVEARGRLVSKELAATHFLMEDFDKSYVKTIEYMGV